MKKFLLTLVVLSAATILVAQAPEAFKYQAVARDASGIILANRTMSFQVSILQGSLTGEIVYSERHNVVTNEFGLVNLDIGKGAPVSGNLATVNWGAMAHYVRIEMDPNGGSSYQLMGISQLMSVPYALFAKSVETGDKWGSQFVITDATLSGTGTAATPLQVAANGISSPKIANSAVITDKLAAGAVTGDKIAQSGATSGQVLKWNGTTWAPAQDATDTGGITLPFEGSVPSVNPAFNLTNIGPGEGIRGVAVSAGKTGIIGEAPNQGILGSATSRSGAGYGVQGISASSSGSGVTGYASSVFGTTFGLRGLTESNQGTSIYGYNSATSGTTYGVYSAVSSPDGFSGYFTGGKFYADIPVGFGTTTPWRSISVHSETSASSICFTNNASGTTATDGLLFGILGTTAYVWLYEDFPLSFGTKGSSRMLLSADGDLGIGTTTPAGKLQISSNSTTTIPQLLLSESDADFARLMFKNSVSASKNWTVAGAPFGTDAGARLNFYYFNGTVGDDVVSITGDGKVGIGESNPTQALHVVGNAYKTVGGTSWAISSDIRLKNLRGNYDKGLSEINALQPVRYVYKEKNPRKLSSSEEQVGFVAQEVQKIFPEAVTSGEDGYLDFNIHPINVAMVNAIRELKAENDRLTSENKNVKAECIRLKAEQKQLGYRLEKIENYLNAIVAQ